MKLCDEATRQLKESVQEATSSPLVRSRAGLGLKHPQAVESARLKHPHSLLIGDFTSAMHIGRLVISHQASDRVLCCSSFWPFFPLHRIEETHQPETSGGISTGDLAGWEGSSRWRIDGLQVLAQCFGGQSPYWCTYIFIISPHLDEVFQTVAGLMFTTAT